MSDAKYDNWKELLNSLDKYRWAHFRNELLVGVLYLVSLNILTFLTFAIVEYFLYLTSSAKYVFFGFVLSVFIASLFFWMIKPLYFFFVKGGLSDEEIALRLGRDFPEIGDKIINAVQLGKANVNSNELILAAINQKIVEFKNLPLLKRVELRSVLPHLRWSLPLVGFILILVFLGKWNWISEGGNRFSKLNESFLPPAPFRVELLSNKEVVEGQDYLLKLRLIGTLPERVYVYSREGSFLMEPTASGEFVFDFDNVQNALRFSVGDDEYRSEEFMLDFIHLPFINSRNIQIIPPGYTGLAAFEANGDSDVPIGSKIKWSVIGAYVDSIFLRSVQPLYFQYQGDELFHVDHILKQSDSYELMLEGANGQEVSAGLFRFNAIGDAFPDLQVEMEIDSIGNRAVFQGIATDDYGVSKLVAHVVKSDSEENVAIPVSRDLWSYTLNLFGSYKGKMEVYFELWDNDAVHGHKSVRSETFVLQGEDESDLLNEVERSGSKSAGSLEKMIQDREELKKLEKNLEIELNSNKKNWEIEKSRKEVIHNNAKSIDRLQKETENRKRMTDRLEQEKVLPDELIEKRRELEKLMEEIGELQMDRLDELKKDEEKGMSEEEMQRWMDRLEKHQEATSEDLARLEELLKRMEVEEQLSIQQLKLDNLSERQEELSKSSSDESKEQNELNKELDEVIKAIDEALKKNEKLDSPLDIDKPSEDLKEAQEQQKNASNDLNQKNSSEANKKQKKASERMKEAANKLTMSIQSASMQMQMESMEDLRQLLDNLVVLSVEQEGLMARVEKADNSDPLYVDYLMGQRKVDVGFDLVKDSLMALSGRVPQIGAIVTEKVSNIDYSIDQTIDKLRERESSRAVGHQRLSMTGFNDLANLLDAVLQQMQMQMQSMMQGNQSCSKPGGSKPSMSMMKALQQSLKEGMEGQTKPGEKGKPGSKEEKGKGQGGSGSSEISKMLSRQEALRQMMEEWSQEPGRDGNGNAKALIEEMKEMEKELSLGRITPEMIERQREIEIKMLELENAERQQEEDNKRESEEGNVEMKWGTFKEDESTDKEKGELEKLRRDNPKLKPFYRTKSRTYLRGNVR